MPGTSQSDSWSPLGRLASRDLRTNLATIRRRVLPGLRYLPGSRVRRCGCCERTTLVASFSPGEEFRVCMRCGASLRYEMLARHLRTVPDLSSLDVVELDDASPLDVVLGGARSYLRTSYTDDAALLGRSREDGVQYEDVTRLTLAPESVDLLVSSEVLEHVDDLEAAFAEMARVLRPGGQHVFTVPPRPRTRRRAAVRDDGTIEHLLPAEYHGDPLDPNAGILTFWDIGIEDAAQELSRPDLKLDIVAGPEGRDGRVVWRARKV